MSFGQCVICQDVLGEDISATLCGHVFHRACISTWLTKSQFCPNCRTLATQNMCIRLYPEITQEREEKGVPTSATKRQVAQLKQQCNALTDHMANLAQHIGHFRKNISDTTQMLRDIHAILDDMTQPPSLSDVLAPAPLRPTIFSRADLTDLQHVVRYLENRIGFYESLYGKSEAAEVQPAPL